MCIQEITDNIMGRSKCRFWKICPMYMQDSATCNESGGMYYDWNRPAGCYCYMTKKENEEKNHIQPSKDGESKLNARRKQKNGEKNRRSVAEKERE